MLLCKHMQCPELYTLRQSLTSDKKRASAQMQTTEMAIVSLFYSESYADVDSCGCKIADVTI